MRSESVWTEFFRQYTAFIKLQIVKGLYSRNLTNLANDPDIVQDIYTDLVEKLISTTSASTIKKIRYAKAWVKTITRNHTRDWIANYFRQKKMARRIAENTGRSLDEPLWGDDNRNYHEVIPDPLTENPGEPGDCFFTEQWLEKLTKEELWALKLKVMFYDPLNAEEIGALASFTDRTDEEMNDMVDSLMDKLIAKRDNKNKDFKDAGRVWAVLQSLESKLSAKLQKGLTEEEIRTSKADIQKRRQRMEKLLNSAKQLIEPSNKDIARILKIPAEKSKQISVVIYRAREKLAEAANSESPH